MAELRKITGVIAPSGRGKTHRVIEHLRKHDRFVVFDTTDESAYLGPADELIVGDTNELHRMMHEEKFRVLYRPNQIDIDDKTDLLDVPEFGEVVQMAHKNGKTLLVIEEAHLLIDNRNAPRELKLAVYIGRRKEMDILYVSHRFASVLVNLRANTDEFWFYQLQEPADIDGVRQRCGKEVAIAVQNLRKLKKDEHGKLIPGECLIWTPDEWYIEDQQSKTIQQPVQGRL